MCSHDCRARPSPYSRFPCFEIRPGLKPLFAACHRWKFGHEPMVVEEPAGFPFAFFLAKPDIRGVERLGHNVCVCCPRPAMRNRKKTAHQTRSPCPMAQPQVGSVPFLHFATEQKEPALIVPFLRCCLRPAMRNRKKRRTKLGGRRPQKSGGLALAQWPSLTWVRCFLHFGDWCGRWSRGNPPLAMERNSLGRQ